MNSVKIRVMEPEDLAFANSLRATVGWNQTLGDWERFLRCEPGGCFVAEFDGQPAGTATTTCYGVELGWIGMLLVQPDHRGRGIGQALLRHCLEHLESRKVKCVKLDATPLGQPLYERHAFRPEWPLTRWERIGAEPQPDRSCSAPSLWSDADLKGAIALDAEVFGVARPILFREFSRQGARLEVEHGGGTSISGFALFREGVRANYLGPVVHRSAVGARELIQRCLAAAPGPAIFWDLPDRNDGAARLAPTLGFTPQRHLLRMVRGESACGGRPEYQFGIADPAVG